MKSFRELGLDIDEIEPGTRSSMDGQVSSGTTFNEWLKGKSPQFQKDYLGAGRYELYKDGKITLSQLVNQQGRTLSLAELRGLSEATVKSVVPDIKFGYGGKFVGYVKDIRPEAKIVIDKLPKPSSISEGRGVYLQDFKTLSASGKETFLHEYGHFIDDSLSKDDKYFSLNRLKSSMESDYKFAQIGKKVVDTESPYGGKILVGLVNAKNVINSITDKKAKALISDIYDSLSKGVINDTMFLPGHGKNYYKREGTRETENFANMFALWSEKTYWAKTKELFPSMTQEFETIMKEVVDGKFD